MTSSARYGSDVVVELLQRLDIPYVAFNPGASFRGLHDSLVNFAGGSPAILEVQHEKIAIGLAHGYAKATGKPLAVITHDLVGLLHATLGVYYAFTDRVPMLVLGGTGPMDSARRRPWIDWVHSANVENTAVRDFTKWDDHPASVEAFPDSIIRAYQISMAAPPGPVFVAIDAALQEEVAPPGYDGPPFGAHPLSSAIAPDPAVLAKVAATLANAERPVIVAGYTGRTPGAWQHLVELAELLPAAVVDTNLRANFPTSHELAVPAARVVPEADVVMLLDVKDVADHTGLISKEARGQKPALAPDATLIDVGFGTLGVSSWSADAGSWFPAQVRLTADTAVALPLLVEATRKARSEAAVAPATDAWRERVATIHRDAKAKWQAIADERHDNSPISVPRLVREVGEAISDYDWVLSAGTASEWARRLWEFDAPHRHVGRSLGTATQIGISLGVALAYRDTDKLVVDLQPDGDLLFDAGALWVAQRHRLPLLVVMVNNRAYNNDWGHQRDVARVRGNDPARAGIGIVIDDPAPDFASLAKAFSLYAEGPITDPTCIAPAIRRAAEYVMKNRQPALVDVVCEAEQ
jgi:benzoylformate decarboxylase/acetolactate synthase-1/2/3 large subunit